MNQTLPQWMNEQELHRFRLHGWSFVRDAVIVALAYSLAEIMRFDGQIPTRYYESLAFTIPIVAAVCSASNYLFGIHRRIWEYAGIPDLRALIDASLLSATVIGALDWALPGDHLLPLTVVPVGATFAAAGLLSVRLWPRLVRARSRPDGSCNRVLIVGAGEAAQHVVAELLANPQWNQHPVGLLDDDPRKQDMRIRGVPVLGTVDDLPNIVAQNSIDVVGVAIPSASSKELDRILTIAQSTPARIQILPSRGDIIAGNASLRLRDINLDDILGRATELDGDLLELVHGSIKDRIVLITGARGSIGFELCKQALDFGPTRVFALDNNETGLFYLQRELSTHADAAALVPVLADITDADKLERIFRKHRPNVVFHAAAYKHVPILESHPEEAVLVNVVGTATLCRLAHEFGCERFVFISTDKAVAPVNALGYSKRIGELLVRAYRESETAFCCVRFGNVVGSRGSALPEFVRQIDAGGPVRVTHPEMERFFMTIPEAVSLVIQAGAFTNGGEIFMLDMGEPLKIAEVVNCLIRSRGLRVGKDIQIEYTGLRPGEKVTEELVFDQENVRRTQNPSIYMVVDNLKPDLDYMKLRIESLRLMATFGDAQAIHAALARVATQLGSAEHGGLIHAGWTGCVWPKGLSS